MFLLSYLVLLSSIRLARSPSVYIAGSLVTSPRPAPPPPYFRLQTTVDNTRQQPTDTRQTPTYALGLLRSPPPPLMSSAPRRLTSTKCTILDPADDRYEGSIPFNIFKSQSPPSPFPTSSPSPSPSLSPSPSPSLPPLEPRLPLRVTCLHDPRIRFFVKQRGGGRVWREGQDKEREQREQREQRGQRGQRGHGERGGGYYCECT